MLAVLLGAAVPSSPALDVHIRVEPDHIILGQPAWIVVDITNRSTQGIVDEGVSYCFETPMHIDIPEAQRRGSNYAACAHAAEDCQTELLDIAPGQTVTRRYTLKGNFVLSAAGNYAVAVHDAIRYGNESTTDPPPLDRSQSAAMNATLTVAPPDAQKLLDVEKSLAVRAVFVAPRPSLPPHADIETLRRFDAIQRVADAEAMNERYALADGLATYPAAGMEPTFTAWLDRQDSYEFGLLALRHLNTPQARAILGRRAAGLSNDLPPTEYQVERWLAVEYLSQMGDQAYLPLLEKLVHDPVHDVQQQAVLGIGLLGRKKDLDFLVRLARGAKTTQDRADAFQAIGETGSLEAVPLLIDLFTLPNAEQPGSSNNALSEITHHQITDAWHSTPAHAKQLWQSWWTQNHATAQAYSPEICEY
ncbi:MAG TPA: HEAT repeat domain-containing protein [Candidatus Baltobacteraceae bacterium]|nr:HEAT repeat domain-containing protein [Candidatus Baltobacteraceae bacterium]